MRRSARTTITFQSADEPSVSSARSGWRAVRTSAACGLAVVFLLLLGPDAGTAQIVLTPPNSTVTATSTAWDLRQAGYLGASCKGARLTGRIAGDGRSLQGVLDLRRTACVDVLFSSECALSTKGRIALLVTGRVRRTSVSLALRMSKGFSATLACPAYSGTIDGEQLTSSCITLTQAQQTLNLSCSLMDSGGRVWDLTASFELSREYTIS